MPLFWVLLRLVQRVWWRRTSFNMLLINQDANERRRNDDGDVRLVALERVTRERFGGK